MRATEDVLENVRQMLADIDHSIEWKSEGKDWWDEHEFELLRDRRILVEFLEACTEVYPVYA